MSLVSWLTPWKPATMAMCPASRAVWIRPGVTSMMRALPWTESVMTPAWLPVNERASWPRLAMAMASRAIEIRSPVVSSMSSSRPGGSGRDLLGEVEQLVGRVAHGGDHDDRPSLPALRVSTIRRATRLMLSASATRSRRTSARPGSHGAPLTIGRRGQFTGSRPRPDLGRMARPPLRRRSHRDDERLQHGVRQLALDRLQPPAVAEDGQQLAVGAAEDLHRRWRVQRRRGRRRSVRRASE